MERNERVSWIDAHANRDDVCKMLGFLATAYPYHDSLCDAACLLAETSSFGTSPQARPIKVVASYYYFIDGGGGGTGTAMRTLSNNLDSHCRSVAIVETFNSPWADEAPPQNKEGIIALDSLEGNHFERLAKALEIANADVLVYHAWYDGNVLWDICLAHALGKRIVINAHGIFTHFLAAFDGTPGHWYDWSVFALVPLAYRLSDAVVCQSQAGCSFFSKFCAQSFAVPHDLPEPYSGFCRHARTRTGQSCNILWVGRIESCKHPEDALEVLKKTQEVIPSATLTMVGQFESEAYRRQLLDQVEKLGISDSVIFAGFQTDVSQYYLCADALLCTSEIEGFCLVVAEACACGMPVVAYDLPYPPFAQCSGIKWVSQGATDQAAAALVYLLQDSGTWQASSAEGQLFVRETLYAIMPDTWNDVLAALSKESTNAVGALKVPSLWDLILGHLRNEECRVHESVKAFECSIEKQRAYNDELQTSYSYRIGHILLSAPRAVHGVLARKKDGGKAPGNVSENGKPISKTECADQEPWSNLTWPDQVAWIEAHFGHDDAAELIEHLSNNDVDAASGQMWNTFFDHYRRSETRVLRHIQGLQQELEREEQFTRELEASYSYRVGHAVLALPRALRVALGR